MTKVTVIDISLKADQNKQSAAAEVLKDRVCTCTCASVVLCCILDIC